MTVPIFFGVAFTFFLSLFFLSLCITKTVHTHTRHPMQLRTYELIRFAFLAVFNPCMLAHQQYVWTLQLTTYASCVELVLEIHPVKPKLRRCIMTGRETPQKKKGMKGVGWGCVLPSLLLVFPVWIGNVLLRHLAEGVIYLCGNG